MLAAVEPEFVNLTTMSLILSASALQVILIITVGVLFIPLSYAVHCGLNYCYRAYARRFCRKKGLEMVRGRCRPAFDESGTKTEFTIFELDCLDAQKQRRLLRLLIWIFGVRRMLSNEKYPESHDEQWPRSRSQP